MWNNKKMINEEENEIDDELWADIMEAYVQVFVPGGGSEANEKNGIIKKSLFLPYRKL